MCSGGNAAVSQRHGTHGVAIRQHGDDDFRHSGLPQVCQRYRAHLGGRGASPGAIRIVEEHFMSTLDHVRGHGFAHIADTDECDFHDAKPRALIERNDDEYMDYRCMIGGKLRHFHVNTSTNSAAAPKEG